MSQEIYTLRELLEQVDLEKMEQLQALQAKYAAAQGLDRFPIIEQVYDLYVDEIMQQRHDPYLLPWDMTPIEENVWQSIRCYGIEMYPQYPVDGKFIDFGNPKKRIGIEADGKKWHDEKTDKERDVALKKLGWTIYRIPGSETYQKGYDIEDYSFTSMDEHKQREYMRQWLLKNSDGVIRAIGWEHFGLSLYRIWEPYRDLFDKTLRLHNKYQTIDR